jgi:N-acetyl sugar amidotransferase
MDTSDPEIQFDEKGECNHCRGYRKTVPTLPRFQVNAEAALGQVVEDIRASGRGRDYDCVIGVSGGVDSTYLAYYLKKILGLRPLAVHVDNGWNSELAVQNIERMLNVLDIDLHTEVLDWHEFRSLQLAFLRSSTPDVEIPTDHAIFSSLYSLAPKERISTICLGINLVTESILPKMWSYGHRDWKYISAVNKQFGSSALKRYPHTSMMRYYYLFEVTKLRVFRLYDYIPFDKLKVEEIISRELGWMPYAAKHYESYYTKFYQGYLAPRKFGFDKRRAHVSSLVCAGQMSRDEALRYLQQPTLDPAEEGPMLEYVAKKLGISQSELSEICTAAPKTHLDYPHAGSSKILTLAKKVYRAFGGTPFRDGISR